MIPHFDITGCTLPALHFGRILHQEVMDNTCGVIRVEHVTAEDFDSYAQSFLSLGFTLASRHSFGAASFCAYTKNDLCVFLSYFPETEQLRIVSEESSTYLRYTNQSGAAVLASSEGASADVYQPLLTQIDLEDFGLSYLLRLSNGRFIVVDGGWDFEPEADKLMAEMQRQSPFEKPRIAAWIFTHPHDDHYPCFITFCKKYSQDVVIEAFLYSFPPLTDETIEKFPRIDQEYPHLALFDSWVQKIGAPVFRPHTGQIYQIGDTKIEILSSPDDICNYPADVNTLSLIFKMTIANQTILFSADGQLDEVKLAQRYGTYLKSDILQIAHHGFNGGSDTCYKLIDPAVCLIPSNERTFLRYMGYFNAYNRTLIYDLNVQDFLIGGQPKITLYNQNQACPNIILPLPYTPRPNGRQLMLERSHEIQKQMGAKSWFFGDMTWECCKFSILNPVYPTGTVYANLYFGERSEMIRHIKITVPGYTVKKVDFSVPGDIDGDALYFNRQSLKAKGIPTDKPFAVHFLSETPIVIWSKNEPVYVY